jgi:heptosyltransferase-2
MTRKILIRGTNWIGDAIMTFPAVSCLRRLYPRARLDLMARPWVAPVYRCHPDIDYVVVCNEGSAMPGRLVDMGKTAGRIRKDAYDMGVLLPNSFESALIFRMAGIPSVLGYASDMRSMLLTRAVPLPGDKESRHHIFYYLDLIRTMDGKRRKLNPSMLRVELRLPQTEMGKARAFLNHIRQKKGLKSRSLFAGFNPGAAFGPAKCWPAGRFRKLAGHLLEVFPDLHILVFGTENERQVAEEIAGADLERITSLCGGTTLLEAVSIINELDLLVTNDSGLMHVGAACFTPVVAIFGSTNPTATGPWSENARVICNNLECAPCMKRQCSRNFECMQGILAEEVFDVSRDMLGSGTGVKP